MLKGMMTGLLALAVLMANACGGVGDHARVSAVHDGMRALGLAQMPDGTYEFRLCEVAESYTPEVLAKKCINPLVAPDGLPLVFAEIPGRPGMLAAQIWNWSITVLAATAVGLSVYGLGRYFVKINAVNELSREAFVKGLEKSLDASQKYDHFKLPEHLEKGLLQQDNETIYKSKKSNGKTNFDATDSVPRFRLKDKLKLQSGKEIELRKLLGSKKLQKKLKEDEAREISELLVELGETLRSGRKYVDTLVDQGLKKMNDEGIKLDDGVLGEIVHEHEGSLVLNDEIAESLLKNRPISKKDREALKILDKQVATVLDDVKEAKSLSSRKENIARLEAAAGFDEVLKAVEGLGDKAIVAAAHSPDNKALQVLTEGSLKKWVEQLGELVKDGSKSSAGEVEDKLSDMLKEIGKVGEAWKAAEKDEAPDIDTVKETVDGMGKFIKETRNKTLKGWSGRAKRAEKELQEDLKTPAYETGAEAYKDTATIAVQTAGSVRMSAEVEAAGDAVVKRVGEIVAGSISEDKVGEQLVEQLVVAGSISEKERKKLGEQLGEQLVDAGELVDVVDVLNSQLKETVREVNNFGDLKNLILRRVGESNLFKSPPISGDKVQALADFNKVDVEIEEEELAALLATHFENVNKKIKVEVEEIIKAAREEAESSKVGFFKGIFTRLRDFKLKDNKIFHYWDKDADNKLAVRVKNRDEVVERLADNEEVGEAQVEKGVEKLVGHLAGVATFVAIPVTTLRQKLPGHARVGAAKRWGNLTGSYELTAEGRVDDMRTIIEGVAAATGAKVSDEVFYFMLRSGLRNKR